MYMLTKNDKLDGEGTARRARTGQLGECTDIESEARGINGNYERCSLTKSDARIYLFE